MALKSLWPLLRVLLPLLSAQPQGDEHAPNPRVGGGLQAQRREVERVLGRGRQRRSHVLPAREGRLSQPMPQALLQDRSTQTKRLAWHDSFKAFVLVKVRRNETGPSQ